MRGIPLLLALLAACRPVTDAAVEGPLHRVGSWAVQLQGLEDAAAVARLAESPYDLLVVDAVRTVRGSEGFDTKSMVAALRKERLVLAYVNVGQAEDYRTYWSPFWRAPARDARGLPTFLLTVDPDGWEGNFPVAYWDPRWRARLWGSRVSLVDAAIEDGFDGVYLDWILGFEEPAVIAAAEAEGVDPAVAMAHLVRDLRAYARSKRPGFLVVAQNGAALPVRVPGFLGWIDGFSQEAVSFRARAGAAWDAPEAGDVPSGETETLLRQLGSIRAAGVPVLTLDYALDPTNAEAARALSRRHGFVPFVSRAPLDRLP